MHSLVVFEVNHHCRPPGGPDTIQNTTVWAAKIRHEKGDPCVLVWSESRMGFPRVLRQSRQGPMGALRQFHGTSMRALQSLGSSIWDSHGSTTPPWKSHVSTTPPWKSHGSPKCFHGTQSLQWCFNGTPMELPWDFHGTSMGLPRCFHATAVGLSWGCIASAGRPWDSHGALWEFHRASMVLHVKSMGLSSCFPPWGFLSKPRQSIDI